MARPRIQKEEAQPADPAVLLFCDTLHISAHRPCVCVVEQA